MSPLDAPAPFPKDSMPLLLRTRFGHTTAIVTAVVAFAAGIGAAAVAHQQRINAAIAEARVLASTLDQRRGELETSLVQAQTLAQDAIAVGTEPPVREAAQALAEAAARAQSTAHRHGVTVEAPAVAPELPVPRAIGSVEPDVTHSGAFTPRSLPAAEPAKVTVTTDDQTVVMVLAGEERSTTKVQEAVAHLEAAASTLETSRLDVDQSADRLAQAAARAHGNLTGIDVEAKSAAADAKVEHALAAAEAVEGDAAVMLTDPALTSQVRAAAQSLTQAQSLALDLPATAAATQPDVLAQVAADLTLATVNLDAAHANLAQSHADWVEEEQGRRADANVGLRSEHALAVATAEDQRTADYQAAVKANQAGWSGRPAGVTGSNGRLGASQLCGVDFSSSVRLNCDAATALNAANQAYYDQTGRRLVVTDAYRTLSGQFAVRSAKPELAATPGTSNHGWGMAVDLDRRSAAWLRANGADYGWVHPTWARSGGSKPESWHLEFVAPGVGELDVADKPELLGPAVNVLDALAVSEK